MILKAKFMLEDLKKACSDAGLSFKDNCLKESYIILDKSEISYLLYVERFSKNTVSICLYKLNKMFTIYPIVDVFSAFAEGFTRGEYRYLIVNLIETDKRIKEQCSFFYLRLKAEIKENIKINDDIVVTQYIIDCNKILEQRLYRDEKFFNKDIIQKLDKLYEQSNNS